MRLFGKKPALASPKLPMGSQANPPSYAELLAACKQAREAIKNEWLYQTGQFSRHADPPTNYPPQGSMYVEAVGVMKVLADLLTRADQ